MGKARESGVDDVCEDGDESEEGKGVEGREEVVWEGVEGEVGCCVYRQRCQFGLCEFGI